MIDGEEGRDAPIRRGAAASATPAEVTQDISFCSSQTRDSTKGVMAMTCYGCNNRRGFWGMVFGRWTSCRNCGVEYCSECFGQLEPSTESTAEWTEGRDCKKCEAQIPVRVPELYGGWRY